MVPLEAQASKSSMMLHSRSTRVDAYSTRTRLLNVKDRNDHVVSLDEPSYHSPDLIGIRAVDFLIGERFY